MARQSLQDKLQASIASTKTLHKFEFKTTWFYVKVSNAANTILIAGTDMLEVSGIVQEKAVLDTLVMLEKDIYLFGKGQPTEEKEKPTCYHKNLPCYGDVFIAFKDGKKIHPIPFSNAINCIEKLQFDKKSNKTIAITVV